MCLCPRNQGLSSVTARICSGKSEIARGYVDNYRAGHIETEEKQFEGLISSARFYNAFSSSSKSCSDVRYFSSQVGATSSGEENDDSEGGFSEPETPQNAVKETITSLDENDDDLIPESELSQEEGVDDDMQKELEPLGTEADKGEKKSSKNKGISSLSKAILVNPSLPLSKVLNKWVEEGNEVTQLEFALTMIYLRRRRMYLKALQVSEWLESTKHLELEETNYASRVDLIAKVQGLFKAEEYIQQIPESLRGEIVYRTLLANYVAVSNMKKAEEVFNKMKKLRFPITCFSCNQLLLLYKRTDKKKIADVLLLMEKENIKPTSFTYQVLIDAKGQSNDITGMEQVVETMEAEGLKPNSHIKVTLARHYANCGLKDKTEALLKEMEGDDIKKNRWVCQYVLPIYASIGKEEEVERIWEVCKSNLRYSECMSAVEAWGKLKKFEKAEEAFNKMVVKKPSAKHYSVLLKVYVDHKMLSKGKELVRKMGESGCQIGPLTWDALVKLYVGAGEVEKADSILEKATTQTKMRALYTSYYCILDKYARRGDIHNAEKIFLKMKKAGYTPKLTQYQTLLQAYLIAKVPAYGFSDRMKADNVYPSKTMAFRLASAESFRKSVLSELLD
ncbi:hypothetical protein ACJIZ3_005600 [Penstemon smallii]|uniref:Pentatricopeptide repeat-containing protein n=1 Tax=Penstemon smallii TaxID=265156 RepID=A0ABD3S5C4_9LAMI